MIRKVTSGEDKSSPRSPRPSSTPASPNSGRAQTGRSSYSTQSRMTRKPSPSSSSTSGGKASRTHTDSKPVGSNYTSPRDALRIIPLGGLEEVGANMMAYEYGDDIIIVDAGFAFPDDSTPGIDYIIPETKYLEDRKKNIRGIFITHGHMDHTGAIAYILGKLGDPPIYSMPLSIGMIKKRLEEFNLVNRAKLNVVHRDDTIPAGNFTVKFFGVNHNIPDSVGLAISTPVGTVIHTGDWKIDHTPINEAVTEFGKIASYGDKGVLALLSDSTNSIKEGYSLSEKEIGKTIDRVFQNAEGRIIFASFSSLIPRIQQVMDIAAKYDRKVIVTGRSIVNTLETAISMGYIKIQPKIIIKSEQASKYPENKIIVLTTGGQGEEASQLARMSRGEHRFITIKTGDTVVISASTIPGNERSVVTVIDNLIRQGADVIYNKILDIHTGGHAQAEELKLMMQLVKPKYFIPIHGELHMLSAHAKIAQSIGIPKENCYLLGNGNVLEIDSRQNAKQLDSKVESGYVFIDGLGVGDVGEVVIRDRRVMAEDGMFVIITTLDKHTGKLTNQPEILSRGFVYMKNNDDLIREVKHEVRKLLESATKGGESANWTDLRQLVRDSISDYLFQKTQRNPMILPVIIEV